MLAPDIIFISGIESNRIIRDVPEVFAGFSFRLTPIIEKVTLISVISISTGSESQKTSFGKTPCAVRHTRQKMKTKIISKIYILKSAIFVKHRLTIF